MTVAIVILDEIETLFHLSTKMCQKYKKSFFITAIFLLSFNTKLLLNCQVLKG